MIVNFGDCPDWEYEHHPLRQELLPSRTQEILRRLRLGTIDTLATAADSRPVHGFLFTGLTPTSCPYYAGHYRGELFHCLRYYGVKIRSDPRVGYPPEEVQHAMEQMEDRVRKGIGLLDAIHRLPEAQFPKAEKLVFTAVFAASVFEPWLRIHPYANGNGHAARFIVWAILGRYEYWPNQWPIDPRPDPPYGDALVRYRNGEREPLERLIIQSLR